MCTHYVYNGLLTYENLAFIYTCTFQYDFLFRISYFKKLDEKEKHT